MSEFDKRALNWDTEDKREIAKKIANTVKGNIKTKKGDRVLDFGTGTGLLALNFIEDVKEIIGIDLSKEMINQFNIKIEKEDYKNIKGIYCDIDSDEIKSKKFDLVISSMVLHHIKNTKEILYKIYNLLEKGGRIALADLDEEEGDFHPNNKGIYHFGFNRKNLKAIAEEIGFIDIKFETVLEINKNNKKYKLFLLTAKK